MLDAEGRRGILLLVEIIHTNELKKSEYVWAVIIYETDDWLDTFSTYQKAEKFCEDNGYVIKGYGKRTVPKIY